MSKQESDIAATVNRKMCSYHKADSKTLHIFDFGHARQINLVFIFIFATLTFY